MTSFRASRQEHFPSPGKCLCVMQSCYLAQETPTLDVTSFEQTFRKFDATIIGGNSDEERMEHRGVTYEHLQDTIERTFVAARHCSSVVLAVMASGNREQVSTPAGAVAIGDIVEKVNEYTQKGQTVPTVLFIHTTQASPSCEVGRLDLDPNRLNSNLLVVTAHRSATQPNGFESGFYGSRSIYKFCQRLAAEDSVLECATKVNQEARNGDSVSIFENGFQDFWLGQRVLV